MKTIISFICLCLISITACGVLGDDKPELPGKIVFSADDGYGYSQIYTMNANGTNLRQLTFWNESSVDPAWSPDGSKIVFSTSLKSSSNGFSLYIMDADGSNMHPMNDREGSPIPTPGYNADWSPDGSKIAFDLCVNCQVSTNHTIFIYDIKADSLIQLTVWKRGVSNTNPLWSPDGSKIAFISDREYLNINSLKYADLYLINANGLNVLRVTESGFPGYNIWVNTSELLQTSINLNGIRKIFALNIETGKKNYIDVNKDLKQYLWLFWNSLDHKLYTVGKDDSDPSITLSLYQLNGKLINQDEKKKKLFQSALGFDWHFDKL